MMLPLIRFGGRNYAILGAAEDAPWVWKSPKADVYYNVWHDLDDSPVKYHYTEPVDPTEYQNEYIGQVIGIY